MADEPASGISDAPYRARCEHGSANLTLLDIAVDVDTSKAAVHAHDDANDRLFVAVLGELYEPTIPGAHTPNVPINRPSDRLYDTMTKYIERHLLADQHPEAAL